MTSNRSDSLSDSKTLPNTSSFNEQQQKAIAHADGPSLVLAGAGTGKTSVLVNRVIYLHKVKNIPLNNILLVTFTNKAAKEILNRVQDLLQENASQLWVGTFHSTCVRILRSHIEHLGFTRHFTILDSEEQHKVIKQIILMDFPEEKENVKKHIYTINKYKDQGIDYLHLPVSESAVLCDIYRIYQERLKVLNSLDFGDLILNCINLFKKCPDILDQYHEMLRYIMVDEYQDTNISQYIWLRILASKYKNIFCVGDEDQSIYGWRGAEINNILKFDQDFPEAKVVKLEQNYRSTQHIISAAAGLIAYNKSRLGKELWSASDVGDKITIQGAWDSSDEVRLVSDEILKLNRNGAAYEDCSILVRASFQTREFEERFMKVGIPYQIIGGIKFYERQEIKDFIAYIRVISQPDDGLAFERILNVPKRSIGLTSIRRIHEMARAKSVSFTRAAEYYSQTPGAQASKASLRKLFSDFAGWRSKMNEMPHVELCRLVLEQSGYLKMLQNEKLPDSPARIDNLKELLRAMEEFDSIQSFLDHVSLVVDHTDSSNVNSVKMMTLHAAKGLEFDNVFLPGWEEGMFPHQKSLSESGAKGLEEERRLAYVGISRARKRVFITYTMQRRHYHSWQTNIPSRFIKELPQEHVMHFNPNGMEIHNPPQGDFIVGERVYHEKYGYGDIIDLDDYGLYIKFDYSGIKKISYKFVTKQPENICVNQ